MKSLTFYTDGACSGNSGDGGWACIEVAPCSCGLKTNIMSGNKKNTTNNEMELTAVYMALVKAYKSKAKKVAIYCDSAYVVNAITKGWLLNWCNNGWVTKEGKPVKNKHIWEKMYRLLYEKKLDVRLVKVQGHTGDVLNELADKTAVREKQKLSEE
jgi:ribonuclease HI